MDIIFNCPKCDQELAVDNSGAGTEIECPSCGATIVIPAPKTPGTRSSADSPQAAIPVGAHAPVNAMSSSAAARAELHLKVPSNKAAECLISKPLVPLEVAAAKEADKRIRVKTIKHTDCVEVGRDKFDEMVTDFLCKIGESNLVSITALTYTHIDIGSQKLLTDFGVMIVYHG